MILNIMFLNHNDFFKILGETGTPREMKNYTWVITVTGFVNMYQACTVAAFPILMGIYHNIWIEGYVADYLAKGTKI